VFMMLMHLLIYLPPLYLSHLAGLLRIYYSATIAKPSVPAQSQPTYLVGLTTAYGTCTWSVPEKSGSVTSTTYNQICVILKRIITRVQCISLQELLPSCSIHILYDFLM